MDNRRVFRSYKDKMKDSATPYSRPNNGLFSKMKLFLTGASLWSNHETTSYSEHTADNTMTMDIEQGEKDISSVKPFSFPEPDTTIFKTPLKSTSNQLRAPNQVLSSFFQEKGDKPLTDIEYEGVVSLLSKSKSASNTPNNSVVYRGDSASRQSESNADSTDLGNKDADTSAFKSSASNLFATPYSQRTLKNTSSNDHVLSTPEYKPVYHTINENFNSKNVSSVKRVYQFSGLPSPYRTRIRAPSLSAKSKVPAKKSPSISKSPSAQKVASKSMSNAANSLLNILDGNTQTDDVEMKDVSSNKGDMIEQFSNPYHRPHSVKKPRSQENNKSKFSINASTPIKQKKSTLLTADDINKTISFDKSEELPKEKTAPKNDSSNTKTSFGFSTEKENKISDSTSGSEFKFNIQKEEQKASEKNPHINPESEKENVKDTPKFTSSHFQPKTNGFSFGKTTKPTVDSNPVYNVANRNLEFIFPEIVQSEVNLDYNKVEKYKSLFEF
mmetsp:Transcript_8345/g.10182  ORF Transcript_8345/g.10182 Transcript_8345/m.10182 type:complete len:499 (+) Transcript_8345:106-1602(+)